MKIYTKTGDSGTTSLYSGERTEKYSLRVEAYGTLDELQAVIGLARAACKNPEVKAALEEKERQLVPVMAEIASPQSKKAMVFESDVTKLEQEIDSFSAMCGGFSGFVLPGESLPSAALHMARAVARRAERRVCELASKERVEQPVLCYINRLSDFLYVLSQCESGGEK